MRHRTSRGARAKREQRRPEVRRQRMRVVAFAAAALTVLGVALVLVVGPLRVLRPPAPGAADVPREVRQVVLTMAGYDPQSFRVAAGQPFAVHLVNPDSPFHTDGGGWHQFRVERLGVDVRIPPRSERTQAFAGLAPGQYEFYCDVCCGGRENPTMRGVIEVTG